MDDEGLEGGNQISQTLLKAIEKSRLSIVVSLDSSFKGLSESWHYLFMLSWLYHVFWKVLADPVGS